MTKTNILSKFSSVIEDKLFKKNPLLIQLNFFTKYIFIFTEYEYLTITPIQINIVNKKNIEITIGTPTYDIVYVNIYKDIIVSKIARFFYNEFLINLNIVPLF
jgi:hypothetical protein